MTLSWAFEGESTPFTVAVLRRLPLDDDLRRAASAAGVALVGAV
jgi:hypothetical protein